MINFLLQVDDPRHNDIKLNSKRFSNEPKPDSNLIQNSIVQGALLQPTFRQSDSQVLQLLAEGSYWGGGGDWGQQQQQQWRRHAGKVGGGGSVVASCGLAVPSTLHVIYSGDLEGEE